MSSSSPGRALLLCPSRFSGSSLSVPCLFLGLDVDGIYRVSGNLAVVQKLRFLVDRGEKGVWGGQSGGSDHVSCLRTLGEPYLNQELANWETWLELCI